MTDTPNAGLEGLVGLLDSLRELFQGINNDDDGDDYMNLSCDGMDEIDAYREKLQSLPGAEGDARDAARYRWMIESNAIPDAVNYGIFMSDKELTDAAIDTALASRRELGGVAL